MKKELDISAEFYIKNDRLCDPYQYDKDDKIWWIDDLDRRGPVLFTFDKKKIYNFWNDYPDNLTPYEKELFDKANPALAHLRDPNVKIPEDYWDYEEE